LQSNDNLKKALDSRSRSAVELIVASNKAETEGLHQAAKLFRALANSDQVQAMEILKLLGDSGDAVECLSRLVDSRTYEISQMFPTFIERAENDGNHLAARLFRNYLASARLQATMLNDAIDNLNRLRETDYWVCQSCGHLESGDMPISCKICGGSREKFLRIT